MFVFIIAYTVHGHVLYQKKLTSSFTTMGVFLNEQVEHSVQW